MNSRNLDTEIAEKVMGWKRIESVRGMPFGINAETGHLKIVPRYSKNISDAMLVVEKMISLGWKYDLHNEHCADGEHVCVLKRPGRIQHAASTSLPMAICLCALEALKSKGGEGS